MTTKTTLKQLALIPLLAVLTIGTAWAGVPAPKPDLAPLFEQWQLEESKIAELETYFQQMHDARMALREHDFESRQERRAAMKALKKEHQTYLQSVLNEDQMEELRDYMRQFRPRHGHKKAKWQSAETGE